MAWFLPSGHKLSKLYECRGTSLNANWLRVKIHIVLSCAGARSRYNLPVNCQDISNKSKNHDKPINFTVRC